jgi:hypothetical protein
LILLCKSWRERGINTSRHAQASRHIGFDALPHIVTKSWNDDDNACARAMV